MEHRSFLILSISRADCFTIPKPLITAKHGKKFELYRDDGLGIVKQSAREIERIKKDLCSIFNTYGLKITIEANKKIVS